MKQTTLLRAFLMLVLTCSCVKPLSFQEELQRKKAIDTLLTRSVALLREGSKRSIEEAEGALSLAQVLDAEHPAVIDGLGCVAWRQGDYVRAEFQFKEALKINPQYHRAYAHLGLLEERRGRFQEAAKLYHKALQLSPLDYQARANFGAMLFDSAKSKPERRIGREEVARAKQATLRKEPIIEQNLLIMKVD